MDEGTVATIWQNNGVLLDDLPTVCFLTSHYKQVVVLSLAASSHQLYNLNLTKAVTQSCKICKCASFELSHTTSQERARCNTPTERCTRYNKMYTVTDT